MARSRRSRCQDLFFFGHLGPYFFNRFLYYSILNIINILMKSESSFVYIIPRGCSLEYYINIRIVSRFIWQPEVEAGVPLLACCPVASVLDSRKHRPQGREQPQPSRALYALVVGALRYPIPCDCPPPHPPPWLPRPASVMPPDDPAPPPPRPARLAACGWGGWCLGGGHLGCRRRWRGV